MIHLLIPFATICFRCLSICIWIYIYIYKTQYHVHIYIYHYIYIIHSDSIYSFWLCSNLQAKGFFENLWWHIMEHGRAQEKKEQRSMTYCWWKKSGDHQLRLVVYPIIYRIFYILGGCLGFLPSTVSWHCIPQHSTSKITTLAASSKDFSFDEVGSLQHLECLSSLPVVEAVLLPGFLAFKK